MPDPRSVVRGAAATAAMVAAICSCGSATTTTSTSISTTASTCTAIPGGSGFHVGTAVVGPADPSNSAFVADQHDLYDPGQLANSRFYPTGYHWKIEWALTSSNITTAETRPDPSIPGSYAVLINFDAAGAREWAAITQAAAKQAPGTPLNRVAMFLDKKVITAPSVLSPSSAITEITGNFSLMQAREIACAISRAPQ